MWRSPSYSIIPAYITSGRRIRSKRSRVSSSNAREISIARSPRKLNITTASHEHSLYALGNNTSTGTGLTVTSSSGSVTINATSTQQAGTNYDTFIPDYTTMPFTFSGAADAAMHKCLWNWPMPQPNG